MSSEVSVVAPSALEQRKEVVSRGISRSFHSLLVYLHTRKNAITKILTRLSDLFKRIILSEVSYPIKGQIVSPATRVIYTHSMRTHRQICLKVWVPCKNEVYDTKDMTRCTSYLVEGLEFNRRFAQNVYLGIAPVKLDKNTVQRGRLIRNPKKHKLKPGELYALVMIRLHEDWRLDHQLTPEKLGTEKGVEFLAREVARMHKTLGISPEDMGKPESILSKLTFNMELFNAALRQLATHPAFIHTDIKADLEKYREMSTLMSRASKNCVRYFQRRYENGRIKRCHGDLKASNLWVRPRKFCMFQEAEPELLALDCVDFNPEFCHIDTLSDIAMLAVDIEMRLTRSSGKSANSFSGYKLTRHFLNTYLRAVGENGKEVRPLLEYYMTEKAMVCAYMSILYDDLPSLGLKYLDVALTHAQRLAKMVLPCIKKGICFEEKASSCISYQSKRSHSG